MSQSFSKLYDVAVPEPAVPEYSIPELVEAAEGSKDDLPYI